MLMHALFKSVINAHSLMPPMHSLLFILHIIIVTQRIVILRFNLPIFHYAATWVNAALSQSALLLMPAFDTSNF